MYLCTHILTCVCVCVGTCVYVCMTVYVRTRAGLARLTHLSANLQPEKCFTYYISMFHTRSHIITPPHPTLPQTNKQTKTWTTTMMFLFLRLTQDSTQGLIQVSVSKDVASGDLTYFGFIGMPTIVITDQSCLLLRRAS